MQQVFIEALEVAPQPRPLPHSLQHFDQPLRQGLHSLHCLAVCIAWQGRDSCFVNVAL